MHKDEKYVAYLTFQFSSVGIGSFQLASNILLKFLHVKQLDRFVQLQRSRGEFDNFVGNSILRVRDLDEHVCLGYPLDQDIATVIHLYLATLKRM